MIHVRHNYLGRGPVTRVGVREEGARGVLLGGGLGRGEGWSCTSVGGLIPTARGQEGPAVQCGCRFPGRTQVSRGQSFFTDGENKESGQTCPPGLPQSLLGREESK